MNTLIHIVSLLVFFYLSILFQPAALAQSNNPASETEQVQVSLNGDWDTDHALTQYIQDKMILKEIIPKGQYVDYWNRYYRETTFLEALKNKSRKQLLKDMLNQKKSVERNIYWNIIAELPDRTIYEWKIKNNKYFSDQHEVAMIIEGKKIKCDVAYVELGDGMPEETRNYWIKTFTEAHILSTKKPGE